MSSGRSPATHKTFEPVLPNEDITSYTMSKIPAKPAALPAPSVGSANPSASLPALWGYILPALNHIARSPTSTPERAPAIDIAYRMGIHTAAYNYITAVPALPPVAPLSGKGREIDSIGTSLYLHLDRYFTDLALEMLVDAPEDDKTLIQYLIPCFKRYAVSAHTINRLLGCINKNYVDRAINQDRGWLTLGDMLDTVTKSIEKGHTPGQIAQRLVGKRMDELKRWGYKVGGPLEKLAEAELCAEAASSLDRIVPLEALALRRFRTEFIESLLATPKAKKNGRRPGASTINGPKDLNLPRCRLARTLEESPRIHSGDSEHKEWYDLATMLRIVGVQRTHPMRKKLDKFLTAGQK